MSAQTIKQRNALRTARGRNHPSVAEGEWLQPSTPPLTIVRPVTPSRAYRAWHHLVEAAWRAHDTGMGPAWVAAGVLVLSLSAFVTYGIGACFFGWPL